MAESRSDAELLAATRRGEHHAFGALVERYQRVVAAVSYSRTRDDGLAEDVTQETFLAAWRQLDQLREPDRLRPWLCGIARNLAAKARKRASREVATDEAGELRAHDDPFEAVSDAQAERVVSDALERVPETYRDALVLYYREQLPIHEVAAALEISENAAMQRLSRGRQYLAAGVAALVDRSLRVVRTRRNVVATVLAALPAASVLAPSRVEASTPREGSGVMIKSSLVIAAACALAGGSAVVIATRGSTEPPATSAGAGTSVATDVDHRADGARPVVRAAPAPRVAPGAMSATEPAAAPDRVDGETARRLELDRGPSRGPANAPLTITMFTDHLCTFCAKMEGELDQLMESYPGKLRIVFKQTPVHDAAKLAAEAAYAAEAQGKYQELHAQMTANQEDLSRDAILALATTAGLDVTALRDALDRHTYAPAVAKDLATLKALELEATPAFVIGGVKIVGADPAGVRQAIDDALD